MNEPALGMEGIRRSFVQGNNRLEVLKGVSLGIDPGEIVALIGPSGAGKSTLLQIAGLLEPPDEGRILVASQDCGAMNDDQRTGVRRHALGFVYQFHHLLPEFSAQENVMLPQMIAGKARGEARERAKAILGRLGLGERLTHRPARLSGGEQQRVAIARALANGPKVLLADEPTGNLDGQTANQVFGLLMEVVREHGAAALIATHNPELASRMDRTVRLADGILLDARSTGPASGLRSPG
jgi:lipoprotein-releasing system ATP-binding protein